MAGKNVGDNLPGAVEGVQQVVWRRPINASNVIIKSAGHLVLRLSLFFKLSHAEHLTV